LAYLFAEVLQSGGYAVDVFTDPVLASKKIGSEHSDYALVPSDMRMPELSGVELARWICKKDNNNKILLISAFDNIDYEDFQHIRKPVTMTQLLEMVTRELPDERTTEG
jgi:DNA-binding NtrC family response regulator